MTDESNQPRLTDLELEHMRLVTEVEHAHRQLVAMGRRDTLECEIEWMRLKLNMLRQRLRRGEEA